MRPHLITLALVAVSPLHAMAAPPADAADRIAAAPAAEDTRSAPAAKFAQPYDGVYAGGQPDARDLAQLHAQGVRTLIDLRATSEDHGFDEAAEAARLGMAYVSLPIGKDDISAGNADALQALLRQYGEGTLVHCASGNRVGALIALGAARTGASREDALALGRLAGLKSLEPVVAAQLDAATAAPSK
ncbi:MAG: tyrosine-protein phosphatase [Pseudoxanthomonas sp.]|nr:tyrosine-protein phosphatase [Pseudoxanthomonas sp.]